LTNTAAKHRDPRKRPRSPLQKTAEIMAGVLLMIFAPIIGGPIIPGPFGFIGFAMGLALVLRNSRWARKRYILVKRRYPGVAKWVDLGLRRRKRARAKPLDQDRQQREQHQPRNRQQDLRTQE
jgi:hypothetical protein